MTRESEVTTPPPRPTTSTAQRTTVPQLSPRALRFAADTVDRELRQQQPLQPQSTLQAVGFLPLGQPATNVTPAGNDATQPLPPLTPRTLYKLQHAYLSSN